MFPQISVPPQILPFEFAETAVSAGEVTTVSCTVHKGDLPVNITWYHDDKLVDEKYGIFVQSRKKISSLSIDDVNEDHSGNYTCVAKNSAGMDTYTNELHVNGSHCSYLCLGYVRVLLLFSAILV